MSKPLNLTNYCLIAPRNMPDERFSETVIYIARHDDMGALGLVINQPMDVPLAEILHDLDIEISPSLNTPKNKALSEIERSKPRGTVLYGGPLRPEVGFVLHTGQPSWHSSVAVTENICLTTSKDILEAIARDEGVSNYQVCLGHASWHKDQLEDELARGDWYVVGADTSLLFGLPHQDRWRAAALKAGIDFDWLVDNIGHA